MAFQPAFNARLINEVRKHPCLYNHSRRGSGDTMERHRLWESIAKNIDTNCAAEFAKKRWLQLRDRYRKELKLALKNGFQTPVRWCYFNQLSWLDPYLKDNILLAGPTTKKDDLLDGAATPPAFNWFDFSSLGRVKDECVDIDDESSPEASVLDRLLASAAVAANKSSQHATRMNSISPEISVENDDSGTQSVDDDDNTDHIDIDEPPATTSRDDVKTATVESLIAANQARFAHHLAQQLSQAIKPPQPAPQQPQQQPQPVHHNHHHHHQDFRRQMLQKIDLQQVGKVAIEWLNDEDLLYSRIIGLKLKKMEPKKRKRMREQIMQMLDEPDDIENDDSCSSHSKDS